MRHPPLTAAMYSPQCHASEAFEVFPKVLVYVRCSDKFGHGGHDSLGLLAEVVHASHAHGADFSWRQ